MHIILSAGIGNVAVIGKFDLNIGNLSKNIGKLDVNINALDDRLKMTEIEQGKLKALYSFDNLKLAAN